LALSARRAQVFDGIEFEHLFGFDSKFLLARNRAVSCDTHHFEHWYRTGRGGGGRQGVCQVTPLFLSCCHFHPLTLRSSPVGVFPKPENAVFVPIPITLRANDAERSGRASSLTAWLNVSLTYSLPTLFSFRIQSIFWKAPLHHLSESSPNSRARSITCSKCLTACSLMPRKRQQENRQMLHSGDI
jgi:hypothetical protein